MIITFGGWTFLLDSQKKKKEKKRTTKSLQKYFVCVIDVYSNGLFKFS